MKRTFNLGQAVRQPRRLQPIALVLLTLLVVFGLAASPRTSTPTAAQEPETPSANPNWTIYTLDDPALFYNMSTRSLRFTSQGVPCVAYGADHLYYSCYDSNLNVWNREIVDSSNEVGQWASLAFSTGDSPRISYYDAANNSLKFAYKVGGSWIISVVDAPGDGNAPTVMEPLGSPSALEVRRESQARRYLESLLPESFFDSQEPELPTAATVGKYSTIAVGTDNKVHIAYIDDEKVALKYAAFDGATWTFDTVELKDQSMESWSWPAIALNSQNNPGISYTDEKYDDLKYAWYDGNWHTKTVDTGDPLDVDSVGFFTSLAYDSSNRPHISYLYNGSPPSFSLDFLRYATINNSGNWTTLDLDINSGRVGWDTSIAITDNNTIYISYYDIGSGNLKLAKKSSGGSFSISTLANQGDVGRYTSLDTHGNTVGLTYMDISKGQFEYMSSSGSTWSNPKIIDFSAEVGFNTSLATNKINSGMITYFDETKDDIKIAFGWNGNWNKGILDGPGNMGPFSSAKFNSLNEPYVAYYDLANGNLQFAYYYAGAWRYQTVDNSTNDVGKYVSLAIDSQNRPHVAYFDETSNELQYAYANWDTNNKVFVWALQPALDSAGDVGQYASLALDSSDKPHITYYDDGNDALKHAFKTPIDAWTTEFVDNPAAAVGKYSSLVVYDPNTLYVTYYDETNGNLLFAQKNGNIWTAGQIIDGSLPAVDVGQYTSLTLDKTGMGHLSYYDVTNGDLKYATYTGGIWTVDPMAIDDAGNVGMFSSLAITSNGQVGISYYDYTNAALKFATLNGVYPWVFIPYIVKP